MRMGLITCVFSIGMLHQCYKQYYQRRCKPVVSGDRYIIPTLAAPAEEPNIVTLFLSPPNACALRCTHFKSSNWSNRP